VLLPSRDPAEALRREWQAGESFDEHDEVTQSLR
jgi:hypothetical protein